LRRRLTPLKSEGFEAFLSFARDDDAGLALVVIRPGKTKANIAGHLILFTKKLEAARRGVHVEGDKCGAGRVAIRK